MSKLETDQEPIITNEKKTLDPSINGDRKHYGTVPEPNVEEYPDEEQSRCSKCITILSSLTIEPALFAYLFAYILNSTCMTNITMDKGCTQNLNYTPEICNNHTAYPEERDAVERFGSDYSLYISLLTPLGALTMMFVAPWSDKYGRKPPLVMAILGSMVSDIGFIMCAYYFDSKVEYLILANAPMQMFGGFISILTIVFSHASEVSSSKRRTLKYTTVELSFGLALSLGSLTGGLLYRSYGYVYVFSTSLGFHALALLWTIFVVPETRGQDSDAGWKRKFIDLFSFKSVKDGLQAFCKVRPRRGRLQLWTLLGSVCFMIVTYEAFANIGYLYAHHQFDWGPDIYNEINTIFSLIQMVVLIVVIPLLIRVFKVNDPLLGIVGSISSMAKNITIAFAANKDYLWVYYLGHVSGIMSALAPLSVRARISKLVEPDELARVFSFLATCEALVPMLGTIMLSRIFNATLDIFPSICYLTAGTMLILPFTTFIWQYQLTRSMYSKITPSISNAEVNA